MDRILDHDLYNIVAGDPQIFQFSLGQFGSGFDFISSFWVKRFLALFAQPFTGPDGAQRLIDRFLACLLYTSDAADE